MTDHTNDERTVRCPVEGCDATPLARGVNLHVNRSSGDGHGPRGEVPSNISFENLETVGDRKVKMDYPDERDNERHARLCPYCSQTFSGVQGLMIHLGQTAGRKNHPANPKDRHEPGDFPCVEVDAEGNVQQTVDTTERTPEDSSDKGAVPAARVFGLIADLVADGETRMAHRVRRELIGVDTANRPVRDSPTHPEMYDALLARFHTDGSGSTVNAVLEDKGVTLSCGGTSALYTADEALDLAAGLEQADSEERHSEEITDLVGFLRYSAEVLDGEGADQDPHEEFEDWR